MCVDRREMARYELRMERDRKYGQRHSQIDGAVDPIGAILNRSTGSLMKFIYADSMDYVDPDFDFKNDRNAEKRVAHRDDEYPHEFLARAPYDGVLVSRGIVGDVY